MFFEFHLKIKSEGAVDQDFSKGLIERNAVCDSDALHRNLSLQSCQSNITMRYAHVSSALEASLEVNVLNGKSNFTGKVAAWTAGNGKSKIVLYDSQAAGTMTALRSCGSVSLTRRIVSVRHDEKLMLQFSVCEGDYESGRFKLVLGPRDVEERMLRLGPYELQVKIVWTCVTRRQRPNMFIHINNTRVLWG
ncbi:hypothetical protein PR202_ga24238 [Eleusine coracana subsp. coracana]|uniref:DUF6598 domain-containing protein n=1 Tax=Eleusine coracana subsp. coracana TaxID=191504 RepID=A0AAV5D8R5_ELECO|nr:hypothetical protein PR202_ga24238 [Eleusine coracana subsp. coracana]